MKKLSLLLVAVLALGVSCKKTVEGEKKAWERNLKNIETLSYEYPSFKTVLNEQITRAEPVMKAAEAIIDEKEKIKKMGEANSLLNAAFVRNLGEIKSLKEGLKTKIIDVRGLDLEYSERRGADRAIDDADDALRQADYKLRENIENATQADVVTNAVVSNLKSAESNLERITEKVAEREEEEQKVEEEKELAEEKAEEEKRQAALPVKCEYCGTENSPDAETCKSCGAPLPKKKT